MYPMIPGDALGGMLEMTCYVCTVFAALLSCLFCLRG